ncbi:MAG: ABC transporter permease [Gammaproteobacteria bacterium]
MTFLFGLLKNNRNIVMIKDIFSFSRIGALFKKELLLMKRDPIIFVSIIIFPIVEIILFSILFNVNPRHIPTTILAGENTPITRSLIQAFINSDYFQITKYVHSESEAERLLKSGKVRFIINIPPGFSREVLRGQNPNALITADAANPLEVTGALASISGIIDQALTFDLVGPLTQTKSTTPFNLIIQERYNPDVIAQYYTVPCLISLVLGVTMLMLSSTSISKEKGEGTLESLLTTPARPIEVILSKMIPYVLFGYAQLILTLAISHFIFHVPFEGSFFLFLFAAFPLILSLLAVGLLCSVVSPDAQNAIQLASYFFALSAIFSGFFFPFVGMPYWAQWIGNSLPLTHYIRINIGISLKGNMLIDIWPDLWPIIIFMFVVMFIALRRYRQTLD